MATKREQVYKKTDTNDLSYILEITKLAAPWPNKMLEILIQNDSTFYVEYCCQIALDIIQAQSKNPKLGDWYNSTTPNTSNKNTNKEGSVRYNI
jgi:hypothetical protein